jgi:RNA exonuclease 4
MAVYRIHKKGWEKGSRPHPTSAPTKPSTKARKRTAADAKFASDDESDSDSDEPSTSVPKLASTPKTTVVGKKGKTKDSSTIFPGGGRKGVSSGLSTVVKKVGGAAPGSNSSHSTSRGHSKAAGGAGKSEWWKQLPGGVTIGGGAKASIKIGMKR